MFENLVANALLKDVFFRKDTAAFSGNLMYLKNREKKDVDFLVTGDDSLPERMVEVKLSDGQLSANLAELEYIRQPVIVDTSEEKLEVEVYVCNKVMSADNVEATQGDFVKFLRAI